MAAVAFKATVTFAVGSQTGQRLPSYFCTVSDVAAAYYIFQDGGSDVVLPNLNGQSLYLVDVMLTPAYGTDTTTADIYAGGKVTPFVIVNSANQATTIGRQFEKCAAGPFLAGARVKFTQRT